MYPSMYIPGYPWFHGYHTEKISMDILRYPGYRKAQTIHPTQMTERRGAYSWGQSGLFQAHTLRSATICETWNSTPAKPAACLRNGPNAFAKVASENDSQVCFAL